MPKLRLEIAHDVHARKRSARRIRLAALLLAGALMGPVLLEGGSLCLSQWHEVIGKSYEVRTPILDAIGKKIERVREDSWELIEPHVEDIHWNAAAVFPILAGLMIIAMVLLKH
jgi:hypothetical protein